jgi:predicted glycoside hydrolase/deacetylase ChbG (UPF0249 family)
MARRGARPEPVKPTGHTFRGNTPARQRMSKQLIVNADDYGRAPGVSQGILKAHREGIVTSTTVMVNQPWVEAQLAQALACPDLGIGQHLVFSAWRPLLPPEDIPALVDEHGLFLDQHSLWARAEEIPPDQVRAELTAQIERFVALAGHLPDHLDCHHFVHLYPPFFQVYADLAARFGLPLRVPFPPETEFEQAVKTLSFLEGFPRDLVRGMIVTNSALLKARRLAYPDRFISTFFGRQALTLDSLLALLDTLADGISELMCHPGFDDPALVSSSYRAEREVELALLTHPAVRRRVEDLGIELVTFGVLRAE